MPAGGFWPKVRLSLGFISMWIGPHQLGNEKSRKNSITQGQEGSGPKRRNGPEPNKRGRQAYFTQIPPPGHIGQLAHSGKTFGKNHKFWPFGPPCGPRGGAGEEPELL